MKQKKREYILQIDGENYYKNVETIIAIFLFVIAYSTRLKEIFFISPTILGSQIYDTGLKYDMFSYYRFLVLLFFSAILSALLIYYLKRIKGFLVLDEVCISLFIFIIAIYISTIISPYKMISLIGLYNSYEGALSYLCYTLIFIVIYSSKFTSKGLKTIEKIMGAIVITNLVFMVLSYLNIDVLKLPGINSIFIPKGKILLDKLYLDNLFGNVNYLSGMGAFFATYYLTKLIVQNENQVINYFFLIASFLLIIGSLSLSGLITFIVLFLILCIYFLISNPKKKAIKLGKLFLIIFLIFFTLININNEFKKEFFPFGLSKNNNMTESPKDQYINTYFQTDFKKSPQIGNGRLFIWHETMKLILQKPFLGYGLETFVYNFPQNQIEVYNKLGSFDIVVDKPHNIFLKISYGSGLIGLATFCLFLFFGVKKLAKYFGKGKSTTDSNIFCFFFPCVAFLIQGLVNDSTIFTSVFFWIFWAISLNLSNADRDAL